MKIHGEDECTVCGCKFQYDKGFKPVYDDDIDGLMYEVRIITEHPRCRQILKKIEEGRAAILDAEFELFCKKYNFCKYNKW